MTRAVSCANMQVLDVYLTSYQINYHIGTFSPHITGYIMNRSENPQDDDAAYIDIYDGIYIVQSSKSSNSVIEECETNIEESQRELGCSDDLICVYSKRGISKPDWLQGISITTKPDRSGEDSPQTNNHPLHLNLSGSNFNTRRPQGKEIAAEIYWRGAEDFLRASRSLRARRTRGKPWLQEITQKEVVRGTPA